MAQAKRKAGHPTKYDDSMPKRVDEYLLTCVDEHYEFHKTRGDRSNTFEQKVRSHLPTVEGLSQFLNVSRDTIFEWAKVHKKFSDSLSKLNAEQKRRLMEKSIDGTYNSTIAKLILSANHGMREKTDITTDGKAIPTPILAGLTNTNVPTDNSNQENSQS